MHIANHTQKNQQSCQRFQIISEESNEGTSSILSLYHLNSSNAPYYIHQLYQPQKNIGRTFNLDTITMLELLRSAEKTGELKIIRTAGLDVIHLTNPKKTFLDYAEKFYQSINGNSK